MSTFKTPLASETIKELIFKSLPILNLKLNSDELNLIRNNYNADSLFEALVMMQKHTIDKKSEKEIVSELYNILSIKN